MMLGGELSNTQPGYTCPRTRLIVIWLILSHREFLTGFSKRKQEKKEAARLRAVAREKEEAKMLRQQVRLVTSSDSHVAIETYG